MPIKWKPHNYQKKTVKFILDRPNAGIFLSPGLGKQAPNSSIVYTVDGEKTLGEVKVWDKIIGADGKETVVLGVYPQGSQDVYEITFGEGSKAHCGLEHLWKVFENYHGYRVLSLQEILNRGCIKTDGKPRFKIPLCAPVEFNEATGNIDSYVMGVLIGDGSLCNHTVLISNPLFDSHIITKVKDRLPANFSVRGRDTGGCMQYIIKDNDGGHNSPNVMMIHFKAIGINVKSKEKFIPDCYKFDSIKNRVDLLHGLMDTDGSCTKNRTTFHTLSERLADDVCWLVRSLGGIAIKRTYDRSHQDKGVEYQVNVKPFFNPFSLPRKANEWHLTITHRMARYITKIEKLDYQEEQTCIRVSASDSLYLTNDFVVTHNSSITLSTITKLKKAGEINKVLILCPLRVAHSVWVQEGEKWTDFNGLKIVVLHGKHKDELLSAGDFDIAVMNYEGLDWLTQVEKRKDNQGRTKISIDMRRWKKLGFDMLVLDELSKLKAHGTNRFKTMREILPTFKRRVGLTGSPASNSLLDLWGEMYMLDLGASLGQYITHYRTTFFTPDYSGFNWKIKTGKEEEIYARIAPIVIRMKAEDYLELPAQINNTIKVELPPAVMKFYKTLEDDFIAMIDNNLISAANAAVVSGKIRQVSSGGIYITPDLNITGFKIPKDKRDWIDLHSEKIDALADLIEELQGQQLLVAYDFNHDLERIKRKFGDDVAYIGSGVSVKKAKEYEAQWNSGELRLLFGHPQSIAHGLNLQGECYNVCFHSLPWSYENYDQFIKRVLRQGNKNQHVFVHHIIAENTIDELVVGTLQEKEHTQNALFDGLKKLARSRK